MTERKKIVCLICAVLLLLLLIGLAVFLHGGNKPGDGGNDQNGTLTPDAQTQPTTEGTFPTDGLDVGQDKLDENAVEVEFGEGSDSTQPPVNQTDPTNPTESTPVTGQTQPTTSPTQPTTSPTQPTTSPTQPTADPTDPTTSDDEGMENWSVWE